MQKFKTRKSRQELTNKEVNFLTQCLFCVLGISSEQKISLLFSRLIDLAHTNSTCLSTLKMLFVIINVSFQIFFLLFLVESSLVAFVEPTESSLGQDQQFYSSMHQHNM